MSGSQKSQSFFVTDNTSFLPELKEADDKLIREFFGGELNHIRFKKVERIFEYLVKDKFLNIVSNLTTGKTSADKKSNLSKLRGDLACVVCNLSCIFSYKCINRTSPKKIAEDIFDLIALKAEGSYAKISSMEMFSELNCSDISNKENQTEVMQFFIEKVSSLDIKCRDLSIKNNSLTYDLKNVTNSHKALQTLTDKSIGEIDRLRAKLDSYENPLKFKYNNIRNTDQISKNNKRSAPQGCSPLSKKMYGSTSSLNMTESESIEQGDFICPNPIEPFRTPSRTSKPNFAEVVSNVLPGKKNMMTPKSNNGAPMVKKVAPGGNIVNNDWRVANEKNMNRVKARNGLNNGGLRRTRENKGINGSNHSCNLNINLNRAPRRFHYKIGQFLPDTTESDLKCFVSNFIKGKIEVETIVLRHNKYYKLFRVSVEDTYDAEMLNCENWPFNINVCRFFFNHSVSKKDVNGHVKDVNGHVNIKEVQLESNNDMDHQQSNVTHNGDNNNSNANSNTESNAINSTNATLVPNLAPENNSKSNEDC
jgi:hypothetical protein